MANYKAMLPMVATRTISDEQATYTEGKPIGKLISVGITPSVSDVKLYGDDAVAENVVSFTNAQVALSTTTVPADIVSQVWGVEGTATTGFKWGDTNPPFVGFGFIATELVDDAEKYKVVFLPKCKFSLPTSTYNTKGETVTFGTPALTATAYLDECSNDWQQEYYCESQAEAIAKLKELVGIVG